MQWDTEKRRRDTETEDTKSVKETENHKKIRLTV